MSDGWSQSADFLGPKEQEALRDRLLSDLAADRTDYGRVLRVLFGVSIEAANAAQPRFASLAAQDLVERLNNELEERLKRELAERVIKALAAGIKREIAERENMELIEKTRKVELFTAVRVNSAIHYLREYVLNDFFEKDINRTYERYVEIGRRHGLRFPLRESTPPTRSMISDQVNAFWKAYLDNKHRSKIYYPEPQFFKDRRGTYFRNSIWNSKDDYKKQPLLYGYLDPDGPVVPSYSFVPSGFVAALARLLERFAGRVDLRADRLGWSHTVSQSDKENVIIIGSPMNLNLVEVLTADLPIRLKLVPPGSKEPSKTAVHINGEKGPRYDEIHSPRHAAGRTLKKWVVVTRQQRQHEGYYTTMISGHSRAVEQVVEMLLGEHERCLNEFAAMFTQGVFAGEFQALFEVNLRWSEGNFQLNQSEPNSLRVDRLVEHQDIVKFVKGGRRAAKRETASRALQRGRAKTT